MADQIRTVRVDSGDEDLSQVLKTLLFYSLLILSLPIATYFSAKAYIFEAIFGMDSSTSYFYAAILAIVVVHVILAMFIYVAWTEGRKPTVYKAD